MELTQKQVELQQHSSFAIHLAADELKCQHRPFANYHFTGKSTASQCPLVTPAAGRATTYTRELNRLIA